MHACVIMIAFVDGDYLRIFIPIPVFIAVRKRVSALGYACDATESSEANVVASEEEYRIRQPVNQVDLTLRMSMVND